jgi:hypothetical protein
VLTKLALIAAIGALVVGALAYPIGAVVVGPTVIAWEVVPPKDAQGDTTGPIDTNRQLFELEYMDWDATTADPSNTEQVAAVLAIYGNSGSEPQQFIWVDEADVIHPPEMPALSVVLQDYDKGKRWKASFVWFFVPRIAGGAALAGLALLGLWFVLKRRAGSPGTPPAAAAA